LDNSVEGSEPYAMIREEWILTLIIGGDLLPSAVVKMERKKAIFVFVIDARKNLSQRNPQTRNG
jgi:hypothetical protein